MQPYATQRTILMGDMNAGKNSSEMIELKQMGWQFVTTAYGGYGQAQGIDHIWTSPSMNWSFLSAWFSPKNAVPTSWISDHPFVSAEIGIYPSSQHTPTTPSAQSVPMLAAPTIATSTLTNVRVLRSDTFESCTKPTWSSRWRTEQITNNTLEVGGEEFWKAGVSWQRALSEGQAIILRFQFTKGAENNLYIDSGKWNTDPYRRFGITIRGNTIQSDLWQGKTGLGGKNLVGDLKIEPETWYQLMIIANKNGEFLTVVSDTTDPSRSLRLRERLGTNWAGLLWNFRIGANKGKVLIDDFMEIAFGDIK
jgi:hypothetical protein